MVTHAPEVILLGVILALLKSGWFDSFPHKYIDVLLFPSRKAQYKQVCAFGPGLQ